MPFLVILIVCCLAFYVYFKVRQVRAKIAVEKRWQASKASIALGMFVALFGFNRLYLSHTTLSVVISIVFILIGIISIFTGYKAYKFYLPHVQREYELQQAEK